MNNQLKKELPYIALFMFYAWFISASFYQLKDHKILEVPKSSVVEAKEVTPTPVYENKYQEEIYKVFGEKDGRIAYAIAQAESHLNPDKCHIDEREYSCGILQINLRAHFDKVPGADFEEKAEFLKDYQNNVLIAKFLHGSSGFWPWSVYKNGVYKKFL